MAVDLEEDRYSKEAVDARLRATEAAEDARALSEMENADPELKEIGDRNTPPNVGEAEAVGGGARWQKNPGWVDKTQPRVGAPMPTNAKLILRNVTKGKKGIIGIAGGIATAVLLGVFFLLPNQLKMAVENITESAARVPGYAIEQRTEYLMTRYIATRVMASVGGKDFDQKMIFCKNGGIACSLTSTKFAEAFDKRFKINTKPITSGAVMNIDIEIQPLSRSGLGGKAMSWNIKQTTTNTLDDQVDHIVRTIDNNKEMKAFLKAEVNRTYKKGFLSRLVGKNILMKRYGVTHFRGLEKTRNTTKKYLAGIGAKVTSNTVGKILPKLPVYFSCLEGGNSLNCEQAIQKASSALGDQIDELQKGIDNETSDTKKESLKKKQEGLKQLQKGIESPDLDGKTGKIIGKNILSKVAGPLAVASIIDLASRVIVSTDEHMLEVISYDIMGQAYVGLAYGDEVGIVPAVDQATVGESSVEGLGTLTSMVANMGAAPLYQYRTGQLKYSSESSYAAESLVNSFSTTARTMSKQPAANTASCLPVSRTSKPVSATKSALSYQKTTGKRSGQRLKPDYRTRF
jgi:hypothetical protein